MTNRTRIKICCISSPEEGRVAAAAGADFLGLVGPMPSGPGILDHEAARNIARSVDGPARPVLLTASDSAEAIVADAARVGVGAVQVVRHVDPAEAARLADTPQTYVQVIHVEDDTALDLIDPYAPHCDYFLLDSGRPSEGTLGGTGATHDWRISAEFVRRASKPVFLAGGLTPDNVAEAITAVRPHGVDLCSGIRRGGALDPGLLAAFVKAVAASQNADP